MGLLSAAGGVPVLLVGLFAGGWVDRVRRRPVMIASGLGRAPVLLPMPLAAVAGLLRIEILYAVLLLTGARLDPGPQFGVRAGAGQPRQHDPKHLRDDDQGHDQRRA